VTVSDLPTLNAALNTVAAVLLVTGWWLIRRGRIEAHRRCMLGAFATSALFLTSYVVYHVHAGSRPYEGTGALRVAYFTILLTHIALAAAILPLALVTLARGLKRDDRRHRRIARWTMPVWLYVSVTGVIIYVMLYRLH
jgi:putative membrane protein